MPSKPSFFEHPWRREIVGEMHLRRLPPFTVPAQIFQLVRLVATPDRIAELASIETLPGQGPSTGARHREGRWSSDVRASWERHSEASTVTVTLTGSAATSEGWIRPDSSDGAEAFTWAEALPGGVVRATRLVVVADDEAARRFVEEAEFKASDLISCRVAGGARIWSDFRIHDDGYGRLVVAANGLPTAELASCVQRLQELGNYRNLALVGLPVARAVWPRLDDIEQILGETGRKMLDGHQRDDDLLLALSRQTEQLVSIAAETDFRMSATAAYAVIVAERLEELQVQPISGFQSLADFTSRRFNPAVRTCAALTQRLALLNGRASQFTNLLRTRIETHIENQNGRLLASMDRSTRMQLRLQHLVEGLSAVAISYYLLGLVSYPLKAAEHVWPYLSPTSILGIAAPLIVLAVWTILQTKRRRLFNDDGKPSSEGA